MAEEFMSVLFSASVVPSAPVMFAATASVAALAPAVPLEMVSKVSVFPLAMVSEFAMPSALLPLAEAGADNVKVVAPVTAEIVALTGIP